MAEFGAGSIGKLEYTLTAAANFSTFDIQYRAVTVGSAAANAGGRTLVCSQAGDPIIGILQNKPGAGEAAAVCFGGISKAMAGAAVTAGDVLRTNAVGCLVTGNSGYIAGFALTGVASGGVFTMAVQPGQATA